MSQHVGQEGKTTTEKCQRDRGECNDRTEDEGEIKPMKTET